MSLVDGIASALSAAGVGTYSPGAVLPKDTVPIAIAGMPPGKGPAVVLTTYAGGPEPDTRNGWEYPRLQVRVRDTDPLKALDLERATYDALHARAGRGTYPRTLTGSDPWELQDCYALQSEAEPLGRDSDGRWEYVRNYQLTARPAGT